MIRLLNCSILTIACIACCHDAWAQSGQRMNLAPFGTLSSWGLDQNVQRFANLEAAAPQQSSNLGIEWREERDIHEVRVRYSSEPPIGLQLQYWFNTWPDSVPEMPTIEDKADDPWQGKWLTAKVSEHCEGRDCRYSFLPLTPEENPLAKNLPGVIYRRTLKLRLLANQNLPRIASFSVYSDSIEKLLSIRIALGQEEQQPLRWKGALEISNGYLRTVKPWGFEPADTFEGSENWSFTSTKIPKGLLLELTGASPSLPGSLDCTLVTVRATAGSEDRTFTFNIDDLKHGPVYVPDFHAYITEAGQPSEFHPPQGKGPRIRSQIPKEPEQAYPRASREIPPLDPWQNQYGDPIYLPLAADSSWQKFAFEYGGNVFIRKGGTKAMGKERERLLWRGDRITWRIGTGQKPYYREDRKAAVSLLDGYLPVVTQRWENDGLRYQEEAFTTLLRGPLAPGDSGRDEQTPAIMMIRLTAENPGSLERNAHVWLNTKPEEQLRISGHQIQANGNADGEYETARCRAMFDLEKAAAPTIETLPGSKSSEGVHFSFPVPAGSSHSIILKLPFVSDLATADFVELGQLDYGAQRSRVAAYWKDKVNASARIATPEPRFDLLHKAVLWHIRMSATKDPSTGLFMVPAASYDYQVYANESCFQILMLDSLGDHDTAAAYLETLLRLQGSKNFPGLHRGLEEAIFHGARISNEYDYTAYNYGLDHPTVLWTLGEHYLYTRDREWLLHAWPHMEKAIAWILKQRGSTQQTDTNGKKLPGYGLLPAAHLEDNSDWAQWFSINSYAWAGLDRTAKALEDIGHPEAERIRQEADAYRLDLREAVLRSAREAPLTQLRDGSYVPYIPVDPAQRFRRFGPLRAAYYTRYGKPGMPMLRLSATREVLYGPIILLNMGVFGAEEPLADWILDDWEDNITLTSGLGMNVHGPTDDRFWFSQGGMVFQSNLQNPILVYLKRHEIPAAIRSLYNNFTACFYPDANAFTEEYREWRHASGPFYKSPDEARFINRIRDALALEQGDTLYLAGGAPRRWLESRDGIRVDHLATYFGPLSYSIRAGSEAGTIEASVQLPSRNPAKTVWLVVRTPSGHIHDVTINGHPWNKIDKDLEAIELPREIPNQEIIIREH